MLDLNTELRRIVEVFDAAGFLQLERARVRWYLSTDPADLPSKARPGSSPSFRSITIDGHDVEFTDGFTNLHDEVYRATLAGRGFGIADARPSIELTHQLRHTEPREQSIGSMNGVWRGRDAGGPVGRGATVT